MNRLVMKAKAKHALKWTREHPARVRAVATIVIALALLAIVAGPFVATKDESRHLSAYADGPRDLSRFRAALPGDEARSVATSPYLLASIQDPSEHVLFVFGVERAYTAGETRAVLDFVRAGGTLVLANDVGNANPLSQELGVVFFDRTILDRQNYLDNPRLVDVTVPLESGSYRVVMNAPAYATLLTGSPLAIVASSSEESFIDVNGDGEIDVKDTPGPFPLVMQGPYGDGRVIVLADAGLFTNEMQAVSGYQNAELAAALAKMAVTGEGKPLIDESRHVATPASRSGDAALRLFVLATTTPVLRAILAVAALAVAALAVFLTRDTEDWSVHTFDVGREVSAPEALAPTSERLTALAARAVCERYNIPFEYLESASLDDVIRLTGDRELSAVAKGAERPGDPRALFAKLIDPVPVSTVTIQPQEVSP